MKKKVVVIGAGRSGRGYVGELLFLDGWQVVYADNDEALTDQLKAIGKHTVYELSQASERSVVVSGYETVNTKTDHQAYIEHMMDADLVMTALFPEAFEQVSKDLAEVIHRKKQAAKKGFLTVTLGANYVGLYKKFYDLISSQLPPEDIPYFEKRVNLVESIILRLSSWPTPQQRREDPLSIQGGTLPTLQINKSILRSMAPEKIPSFLLLEDDTLKIMKKKIWQGNTLHCTMAFMGIYRNHTYIYEAARDPYIMMCANNAYIEANRGLAALYGSDVLVRREAMEATWASYQDESVKDSVMRVGGDPVRKLSRNERFIGPALLCAEEGIIPYFICRGAAYGFFYENKNSQNTYHETDIRQYVAAHGIEQSIQDICGLDIRQKADLMVYQLILKSYQEIATIKAEV